VAAKHLHHTTSLAHFCISYYYFRPRTKARAVQKIRNVNWSGVIISLAAPQEHATRHH